MTEFEKYLQQNREQLELPEVPEQVWDNVNRRIQQRRGRLRLFTRFAAAAAIALLLVIAFQWGRHSQPATIPVHLANQFGLPTNGVDTYLEQKVDSIRAATVPVSYRDDLQLLLQQAIYLDNTYSVQREALQNGHYDTNTLRDVQRYYQAKLELLSRIIDEIEKINHYEKNNSAEQRVTLQL